MLTREEIEEWNGKTKLIVVDTMQFFEIEVPVDTDEEEYLQSQDCKDQCAELIRTGMTELNLERVLENKDASGYWT